MEFSSLVLMEKDKETGFITKELGSFEVNEGGEYIKKFFVVDNIVNLYFDTNKDVEEWEYSAIYDLFNVKKFEEYGLEITEDLEEYNPTFILKFKYEDEHEKVKKILERCIVMISEEMERVFNQIEGKEEEYS